MNKNNPFEYHGIEHLSASSINTYITDPCKFIYKYLFKFPGKAGPGAWRGIVVDEAVGLYLSMDKPNISKVTDVAMKRFKGLTDHNEVDHHEPKVEKERHLVPEYITTACEYFASLGKPEEYQKSISLEVDMPVPIIGYIDLKYDGIVRDIKTVGRMPSEIPNTVKRQLSLYAKAEDSMAIVDYVNVTKTKTDVKSIVVENVDEHFEDLMRGARAIERLLSMGDKYEIAEAFFPNFDSWMWSPEERANASTIWRK